VAASRSRLRVAFPLSSHRFDAANAIAAQATAIVPTFGGVRQRRRSVARCDGVTVPAAVCCGIRSDVRSSRDEGNEALLVEPGLAVDHLVGHSLTSSKPGPSRLSTSCPPKPLSDENWRMPLVLDRLYSGHVPGRRAPPGRCVGLPQRCQRAVTRGLAATSSGVRAVRATRCNPATYWSCLRRPCRSIAGRSCVARACQLGRLYEPCPTNPLHIRLVERRPEGCWGTSRRSGRFRGERRPPGARDPGRHHSGASPRP
jgi:hypothetical protein